MDRNAEIVAKAAMDYFDGKNSLFVKCSDGCIALQTLKPEDSKLLTATDMINGRKVSLGDIFR